VEPVAYPDKIHINHEDATVCSAAVVQIPRYPVHILSITLIAAGAVFELY
jgi:hypothetical protein